MNDTFSLATYLPQAWSLGHLWGTLGLLLAGLTGRT